MRRVRGAKQLGISYRVSRGDNSIIEILRKITALRKRPAKAILAKDLAADRAGFIRPIDDIPERPSREPGNLLTVTNR
jgi:hypothetical protein